MSTLEVSDLPDRIDVTVLAGRRFTLTVPVLYGNFTPVPAVNISGARAHVRPAIDDPVILHVFSTDDEDPDAEVTDDGVVLTATAETTSSWAVNWPGRAPETVAWWDLEVTDVDGEPRQILIPGTITVVHEVTR